ncbi:response regulator [Mariprofundus erugo]|uniref:hybrid sensor histidine kinase/response regulator n=1 Tax=Mariprofundus erugo TaxID=2528639 RepID=UPI0010FDCD6D|nr:ATP-binding protein [Mariprofundus erugo]TLS76479.1 response regulator [Mariprofundus erugo]
MFHRVKARLRLMLSGYQQYSPDENSLSSVVSLLLVLAMLISALFSIVNFMHGHRWLALTQIVLAFLFVPLLIRSYRRCCPERVRKAFIGLAFISFSVLVMDGGIGQTGIYWALLFPFLAFLLMGVRLGWRWVALFTLFNGVLLALHGEGIVPDPGYSIDIMHFMPVMFFCFTIIACAFQLQQEHWQTELQQTNRELKVSQDELLDTRDHLEQKVQERTSQIRKINDQLSREVDEKIEALQKKELAEMKYEHAQKMESMGTLVGGIAHDFNNMLAGISGHLYLIQRQIDADDVQKRLDKIGDLTMYAADMIRQLMTFARKDEVRMSDFDLRAFINEAYKLARVSVPAHIRCELILVDGCMMIHGNCTQIQQVVMNLMNNARDALSGVGEPFMQISLTRSEGGDAFAKNFPDAAEGAYAILTVQDNGCGIPQDKLNRIYEPFYTTKEPGKGTGLGLSMVYGAIKSHGGFIDVASYPGKGTRFSVYFPLVLRSGADGSAVERQVEEGMGETILLVDDDQTVLEVHEHLLDTLGYSVLTASNGQQAVDMYAEHMDHIDLVLTDIVMPVLGGKGAADCIRQLNPKAKILFFSGYARDHDASPEMEHDWHLVMNKPMPIDELSRVIQRQLQADASGV